MSERAVKVDEPRVGGELPSKQRLRLWIRLLRATRFIEGEIRERLRREMDTTLPRFDVMAALSREGAPMTMSELSRYLMVSNGNVTGIIDRLVDDGHVARTQPEGDRRSSLVALTESGEETFAETASAHESWVDELLAPVGMDDAIDAIDILKRFERARRGPFP
ncbi:MAG: MarR family winged helix-turn-helix transcriptional regulator [Geminicoccaceae bacterium]